MPNFSYKTRANSSPERKPRIYFCCHPEDFGRYFEPITDEILQKTDSAIFYCQTSDVERNEDFLFQLSQMQLFVMPVTARLLTEKNPTLEIDFAYAMENHIPVLPLMQESGLDELFNRRCGDLQYLDKNKKDDTAISYEEKLEKYLSSVLIGDELAEKIRAAFDAYVFLSYRKIDRKEANRLMRLIHKNDFCRDIAIWYDEFLTPGEDFNESIKQALDKSELFVLAVTPNLLKKSLDKNGNETENYIVKNEYPMALDAGKLIFPAELVPTDRKELSRSFEGIPECSDANDEKAFSAELFCAIEKIAKKENDGSAEHNYFIGLAYLSGIDVEVDHEKALSLITFAANSGLVDAMTKLTEMYRNGIGVQRAYDKAIEWQEKKIEVLEKAFDSEKLNELFEEICRCGDWLFEIGVIGGAKEKYEKALQLIEPAIRAEIDAGTVMVSAVLQLLTSYKKLGDIFKAEGDMQTSKEYYEKALEISAVLALETPCLQTKLDLWLSCSKLGDMYKAQGDIPRATDYYEKALETASEIADTFPDIETKRNLLISFERLGNIYMSVGNIRKAKEYYQKSHEISSFLFVEFGTPEAFRDLSVSYGKLGDICEAEGDIDGAGKYYADMLEIRAVIAAEKQDVESFDMLGVAYYKASLVGGENAEVFLQKSIDIFEGLHKACPNVKRYAEILDAIKRQTDG